MGEFLWEMVVFFVGAFLIVSLIAALVAAVREAWAAIRRKWDL
jgi:hypothetical protein